MTREPTQTEIAYFHGESIQEHGTHAWQALRNAGLVLPETRETWPPDVPATYAKDYPIAYYVSNMLFYAKQITVVLPNPNAEPVPTRAKHPTLICARCYTLGEVPNCTYCAAIGTE